jgi:hypothetical protein
VEFDHGSSYSVGYVQLCASLIIVYASLYSESFFQKYTSIHLHAALLTMLYFGIYMIFDLDPDSFLAPTCQILVWFGSNFICDLVPELLSNHMSAWYFSLAFT